jgi:UTP--glucose-1-phosphate uridylyltransferase
MNGACIILVKCAVIPVAGLGKRMLPITLGIPKEMLPIFSQNDRGLSVKPILQMILEQLVICGIQKVCFIVNESKYPISDYFGIDRLNNNAILNTLEKSDSDYWDVKDLRRMLSKIDIEFKTQVQPRGFGDAVLCSKDQVEEYPFLVHAGDEVILSNDVIRKLEDAQRIHSAEAAFLIRKATNPKAFGVVDGTPIDEETLLVDKIKEKPKNPMSNMVVIAVYLFNQSIFHALEKHINETNLELTTAINHLINEGHRIVGVRIDDSLIRVDTGDSSEYFKSLQRLLSTIGSD